MSEHAQIRRLQQAELTPGPELWARLEGRMARKAAPERRSAAWYWAAAACLVLALAALPGLWTHPAGSPDAIQTLTVTTIPAPATPQQLAPVEKEAVSASKEQKSEAVEETQTVEMRTAITHTRQTETTTRRHSLIANRKRQTVKRSRIEQEGSLATSQEVTTEAVAQDHHTPFQSLQDSIPRIQALASVEDSLQILVAYVAGPGPGQKRDTSKSKKQPQQRQTIINKLNRALRWLPGGSAWPTIRFEKSEVAIAYSKRPPDEPVN